MLAIRITPGSATPIWQQITTQVRHAIATGGVAEGQLLPSVRTLAEELLINPNTVAKAYGDLSRDGLVDTLPGKGLAVAAHRPGMGLTKAERIRRLEPALDQLVHEAIAVGMDVDELCQLLTRQFKALAVITPRP